jgi:hypothetical protein
MRRNARLTLADSNCQIATQLAIETIDSDHDGRITPAEILAHETDDRSPLSDFIRFVRPEMAWGAGRESHDDVWVDGKIITAENF